MTVDFGRQKSLHLSQELIKEQVKRRNKRKKAALWVAKTNTEHGNFSIILVTGSQMAEFK